MKKKVLRVIAILCIAFAMISTVSYAKDSFYEANINIDTYSSYGKFGAILKTIGFNYLCTPYFMIILYVIIQLIFIKKYKKTKLYISIDIIIILVISIINSVIKYNPNAAFVSSSMMTVLNIVKILINTIILIAGLIVQKRLTNKYREDKIKNFNKTFIKVSILLVIILMFLIISNILTSSGYMMCVVERIFASDVNRCCINIKEGERISLDELQIKVLKIDDEGIVIEYTTEYNEFYPIDSTTGEIKGDYGDKTKIVQQRMEWNKIYNKESSSSNDSIWSGDYYVRFEK